MNLEEKKEIIAEVLEIEPDEVTAENNLDEYDTWDSVAILSVISIMNEKFNKFPSAKDVMQNTTVEDLMNYLQ